jgi:hypothetical protein
VFTYWHTEDGSSFFQSVRKFNPELQTRIKDVPLEVRCFLPKLLNVEATGSSETTANFYKKTSEPMVNFYRKPEKKGACASETTANF